MNFFRLYQHLLPNGAAWSTTAGKKLRGLFEGLAGLPAAIRDAADARYEDIFPDTTSELSKWEAQFGLVNSGLSDADRRMRLAATWPQLNGNESPANIQALLRAAGFDVYLHPWWEPVAGRPNGGSINGNATPTVRNPVDYVWDGVGARFYIGAGNNQAYCGGDLMYCGSEFDPPGFVLVNKVTLAELRPIGCGHSAAYCGGDNMAAGSEVIAFVPKQYEVPTDPEKWRYFIYIGGQSFPDYASVPGARREEFEALCLQICSTHRWIALLINYD